MYLVIGNLSSIIHCSLFEKLSVVVKLPGIQIDLSFFLVLFTIRLHAYMRLLKCMQSDITNASFFSHKLSSRNEETRKGGWNIIIIIFLLTSLGLSLNLSRQPFKSVISSAILPIDSCNFESSAISKNQVRQRLCS